MIFRLTDEDILKVCSQCEHYDDGQCKKHEKPVAQLRRCEVWDSVYREKCIRMR